MVVPGYIEVIDGESKMRTSIVASDIVTVSEAVSGEDRGCYITLDITCDSEDGLIPITVHALNSYDDVIERIAHARGSF